MGFATVATAQCKCSFGMTPAPLMVLADKMVFTENKPMANIMDNKSMTNIMPFGMCQSLANPTVASATAAAAGVLTPMPCVPATNAPWAPGSPTVFVKNMPALNNTSKLMCNWGGVIEITNPGAMKTQIP